MKEITRIHIARNPYDIEVSAKKELEKYMKQLEAYAEDTDILEDIEIRMTELLAERGVAKNSVITEQDIQGLREQLGEPSDFAPEGAEVIASEMIEDEYKGRRLYRDIDNASIGGVLAGFAQFFGIGPIWVRLIFIVLLVSSFGTAAIVYLILWLIIPPARTAAEKLQMHGKPVTLESIKALAVDESVRSRVPEAAKTVLLFLAGLASSVIAIGALLATISVLVWVLFEKEFFLSMSLLPSYEWLGWTVLTLCVVSGLLLSALGVLLAYAAFARKFTKRFAVATVVMIITGLVTFSSAVGVFFTGVTYGHRDVQSAMKETKVDLPDTFSEVKKLSVTAHTIRSSRGGEMELEVRYVVDPGKPRYTLTALPGMKPHVAIDGDEARIAFKSTGLHNQLQAWVQPTLFIYGPALDEIKTEQGMLSYSAAHDGQDELAVETLGTTRVSLYGSYQKLEVKGSGSVWAADSTVYDLAVHSEPSGTVEAGMVRTLEVSQPQVCPSNNHGSTARSRVSVTGVHANSMIRDGQTVRPTTYQSPCSEIVISGASDDEFDE